MANVCKKCKRPVRETAGNCGYCKVCIRQAKVEQNVVSGGRCEGHVQSQASLVVKKGHEFIIVINSS